MRAARGPRRAAELAPSFKFGRRQSAWGAPSRAAELAPSSGPRRRQSAKKPRGCSPIDLPKKAGGPGRRRRRAPRGAAGGMGQGESAQKCDVPYGTDLGHEIESLEDDAVVSAGFAADPSQQHLVDEKAAHAAAEAAASAAALNLGPLTLGEVPTEQTGKTFSASAVERRISEYRLESTVLGSGGFGQVRRATSLKTGHSVAVKIIKRKKMNEKSEMMLQREVNHHERVSTPWIPLQSKRMTE